MLVVAGLLLYGGFLWSTARTLNAVDRGVESAKDAVIGIAGRETAIGDAIGLVLKRLRVVPAGEAVLVLLTDHSVYQHIPRRTLQEKVVIDTRGLWR